MRIRTFGRVALAAALFSICVGTATTTAQTFDKRTFFTFSGPVAIPGVTLPAGQYLFRLADTSSRNVIQVLSHDGMTSYAMFFAFRAERRDATSEPQIRFMETASDMPAAIDTWWYPAERSGYEFVYPKEQARLLARGTGRSVLTGSEQPPAEYTRISPAGEETPVAAEPVYEPAGPVQVGEVAPASLEVAPATQAALPTTGSAIPLVAIGGLLLLFGGAASATWRRVRG